MKRTLKRAIIALVFFSLTAAVPASALRACIERRTVEGCLYYVHCNYFDSDGVFTGSITINYEC